MRGVERIAKVLEITDQTNPGPPTDGGSDRSWSSKLGAGRHLERKVSLQIDGFPGEVVTEHAVVGAARLQPESIARKDNTNFGASESHERMRVRQRGSVLVEVDAGWMRVGGSLA